MKYNQFFNKKSRWHYVWDAESRLAVIELLLATATIAAVIVVATE